MNINKFTVDELKKVLSKDISLDDNLVKKICVKLNNRLFKSNIKQHLKIIKLVKYILYKSRSFDENICDFLLDEIIFSSYKFELEKLIKIKECICLLKKFTNNKDLNQFAINNNLFTYEQYLKENEKELLEN
ncbi:hypothetical protein V2P57_01015 [Mycoplasma mycoides subsp. mycoides]|uniref:Uncharacterized protein n=2 Tax=Mycoplasma mycoides subsp. mycoides TaxID=2103 RepID=Q6MU42_MYCMS|nr:hypothetical protein [Mycoplasma mycoides]QQY78405.1 hypothetical protein JLS56_00965 [Mycoplasma mycoides subsp. capri]CAE76844.1 Hypothetical protein MSC_0199 [Mycoplasma mycoides subsp. mycoides SC str. PG1]ADK69088.1 conserved hypothetical protein [Mycoplasma mycoides subsp. mycoides SC str. Gladysdale]AIZ55048.1 hypothetical protein mycmycITA_00219 [Mycoplasma mycoides subsp. mycoides]AME10402.1 hypothetical protein MmmBen_0209 [Mycoplasma mycoides subsp. mycoides]